MTFAHIIHAIVGALLMHLYLSVRRGKLDPALAIGMVGGSYCFRRKP